MYTPLFRYKQQANLGSHLAGKPGVPIFAETLAQHVQPNIAPRRSAPIRVGGGVGGGGDGGVRARESVHPFVLACARAVVRVRMRACVLACACVKTCAIVRVGVYVYTCGGTRARV